MSRTSPLPWLPVALSVALSVACLPLAACGGCGADAVDNRGARKPATTTEPPPGQNPEPGGATANPEPGPPPEVAVRNEVDETTRQAALVVESRGDAPAELAPRARVERQTGNGWAPVGTLSLRWSCDEPAPQQCATLVRGAELRPPPWLGRTGEAQCACEDCEPAPAGTYRFVVQGCDGAATVAGQPFALGPP